MSKPIDDKLAALLGEDKNILAARLFVESFAGGVQSPLEFRKIRAHLASMAGLGRLKIFSGYGPDYTLGVELVLRWERAMLAARLFAGDSASMYLLLVSDGETVRTSADPYAAALAAIASGTP
ncbi:hypothetical protein [Aeromicrobium stalagmiti]|uniref:hypothetical protein n=1 Tax=Aeromicrobium stalagmiti TaxID=2738988 RepID=UPI0015688846|nr:hypothetical protein [Aeromicrobium stalagmiti]NRQ50676.1 hypothetical protein [Aeromicrobium stalagmiti]